MLSYRVLKQNDHDPGKRAGHAREWGHLSSLVRRERTPWNPSPLAGDQPNSPLASLHPSAGMTPPLAPSGHSMGQHRQWVWQVAHKEAFAKKFLEEPDREARCAQPSSRDFFFLERG